MLSTVFLTFLASAALTSAAPATEDKRGVECPGAGAYYVCSFNGFRGYCSSDPCDKTWCPDFETKTCTKKGGNQTPPPVQPPTNNKECGSGKGAYYVCANNGFRGTCSVDPCAISWCPDYEAGTCTPATAPKPDPKPPTPPECSVGTGLYYTCADNGFRGFCSTDACNRDWCPDYEYRTCKKSTPTPPSPPECSVGTGQYYTCADNGFRGYCSTDACNRDWCPDYEYRTCQKNKDTVTPPPAKAECPGTGAYYVCAKNGFRGYCSSDPCDKAWCADFEVNTCTKKSTWTPPPTTPPPATNGNGNGNNNGGWSDPTVCKADTGYYQVCASGFKGCCKTDACTLGYCPA